MVSVTPRNLILSSLFVWFVVVRVSCSPRPIAGYINEKNIIGLTVVTDGVMVALANFLCIKLYFGSEFPGTDHPQLTMSDEKLNLEDIKDNMRILLPHAVVRLSDSSVASIGGKTFMQSSLLSARGNLFRTGVIMERPEGFQDLSSCKDLATEEVRRVLFDVLTGVTFLFSRGVSIANLNQRNILVRRGEKPADTRALIIGVDTLNVVFTGKRAPVAVPGISSPEDLLWTRYGVQYQSKGRYMAPYVYFLGRIIISMFKASKGWHQFDLAVLVQDSSYRAKYTYKIVELIKLNLLMDTPLENKYARLLKLLAAVSVALEPDLRPDFETFRNILLADERAAAAILVEPIGHYGAYVCNYIDGPSGDWNNKIHKCLVSHRKENASVTDPVTLSAFEQIKQLFVKKWCIFLAHPELLEPYYLDYLWDTFYRDNAITLLQIRETFIQHVYDYGTRPLLPGSFHSVDNFLWQRFRELML